MTTNYTYKTGKNNVSYNNMNSKKGTCSSNARRVLSVERFVDSSLAFIDSVIEFLSSFRFLVVAKAFFAFVALLGFFGIIGGIELGSISLFTGIFFFAIIIVAEFLILKD